MADQKLVTGAEDAFVGLTEAQRGKCGKLCAECDKNETCTDKEKAEACKEMLKGEAEVPEGATPVDEANPMHNDAGKFATAPDHGSYSLQFSGGNLPDKVRAGKRRGKSKQPCGQRARMQGRDQLCQSVEPQGQVVSEAHLAEAEKNPIPGNPWHDSTTGRFSSPPAEGSWSFQDATPLYAQRVRKGKKDRTAKRPCGRAARRQGLDQKCSEQIDLAGLKALAETVRS